jgi:hypothetical protein
VEIASYLPTIEREKFQNVSPLFREIDKYLSEKEREKCKIRATNYGQRMEQIHFELCLFFGHNG